MAILCVFVVHGAQLVLYQKLAKSFILSEGFVYFVLVFFGFRGEGILRIESGIQTLSLSYGVRVSALPRIRRVYIPRNGDTLIH